MSNFRQDIIEALIFGGEPTAEEIAEELDCYYEDVVEELELLRDEGLVRNLAGEGPEDSEQFFEGMAGGEDVHWVFCGGPISQALSVESQMADSKSQ